MSATDESLSQLENHLGRVLSGGVLASAVALACGILIYLWSPASHAAAVLLGTGLVILTLTPMLRVVLSIVEYVRMRELAFAAVTLLVLLELAVGVVYALGRG